MYGFELDLRPGAVDFDFDFDFDFGERRWCVKGCFGREIRVLDWIFCVIAILRELGFGFGDESEF